MPINIASGRFEVAHEQFLQHMLMWSNGVPFTNFQHPFFVADEVRYKQEIYNKARNVLALSNWTDWLNTPGKILQVIKEVCSSTVSRNLLYHRKGLSNSSEKSLYKVETESEIRRLEQQIFNFFLGGPPTPIYFAARFELFANYLRENSLGCNWRFVAYLAFLLSDEHYFPILPDNFDALLDFYGVKQKISGHVSWKRYALLLELADLLREKLAIYGQANMVEIQSYMYVVSYLIKDEKITDWVGITGPDFAAELKARQRRAQERERIGLLGERYIYEQEKLKLKKAGRNDLASRVQLVSLNNSNCGYDILSFTPDKQEMHIEVKTTISSKNLDNGFWLTMNEKMQAEQDGFWCIYRVWNIDASPEFENLGNIVLQSYNEWDFTPTTWYVKRRVKDQ